MTPISQTDAAQQSQEQLSLLPPGEAKCPLPQDPKEIAASVAKTVGSRRYKQGLNPIQPMLLPPSVQDYVTANNPVRAIKAYVETVDFEALGFKNAGGQLKAGQPAYAPSDLLELYLYGYLNRVHSSRRLEAECRRNLEVIWLLNGLRPSYHTIADFRKDNPKALKKTNRHFIQLCAELGLFGGKVIGIDGSFFNGDASHASVKTKQQLKKDLAAIEKEVDAYQRELERNDAIETDIPAEPPTTDTQLADLKTRAQQSTEGHQVEKGHVPSGHQNNEDAEQDSRSTETTAPALSAKVDEQSPHADTHPTQTMKPEALVESPTDTGASGAAADEPPTNDIGDMPETSTAETAVIKEKLAILKRQAEEKAAQIETLEKTGETQLSRTDRDARRLTKHGKKVTGYNVQTVIDAKFKLILAHEVTNAGNDFGQLVPMIKKAKDVLANGIAQAISKQPTAAPTDPLVVLADAGYFTETDIAACAANQTTVYVPVPDKYRAVVKQGRLSGQDFHYDPDQDIYTCPGEQTLTPIGKQASHRGVMRQRYKSHTAPCKACSLRGQCLAEKSSTRTIYRSEHADVIERHRQHMANSADKMGQRAELCEHPFGTMKRWCGWDHFLVRGFNKVRGEMALLVHCYNFKRATNICGLEAFIAACEARRLHQDVEGVGETLFRSFQALFSRLLRLLRPFSGVAGLFPPSENARPAARLGHATAC